MNMQRARWTAVRANKAVRKQRPASLAQEEDQEGDLFFVKQML
jgi:hypothetical protein